MRWPAGIRIAATSRFTLAKHTNPLHETPLVRVKRKGQILNRREMLAGTAAGLLAQFPMAGLLARDVTPTRRFPTGFRWGAATAAYQTEGNNVNSDIWLLEGMQPTTYVERSGDAANSFDLWPVDLDLVKGMGLNTYRFSLEWSRIEPEPGLFSIAMLDHYKAMIEGCHARGIAPFVTFNHFTTPIWFAARGGWSNAEASELFARYCERTARHLADGIDHAATLNEPNLVGMLEVALPGGRGRALIGPDKAMQEAAARKLGVEAFLSGNPVFVPDRETVQQNLMAGHKAGRAAIQSIRSSLPVGVCLAMNDDHAAPGGEAMRDSIRAQLYDRWLEAARNDDFLGVQNYYRAIWGAEGKRPAPDGAMRNAGGSEIYLPSLSGAVRYAHSRCPRPIFVTEHGVDTKDDSQRCAMIAGALEGLHAAISEGVPVLGYIHWSLIDNFEWFQGYKPRYGLHNLDRQTFRRTAKPSAHLLGKIARANHL